VQVKPPDVTGRQLVSDKDGLSSPTLDRLHRLDSSPSFDGSFFADEQHRQLLPINRHSSSLLRSDDVPGREVGPSSPGAGRKVGFFVGSGQGQQNGGQGQVELSGRVAGAAH
jgi:hypothetical protein